MYCVFNYQSLNISTDCSFNEWLIQAADRLHTSQDLLVFYSLETNWLLCVQCFRHSCSYHSIRNTIYKTKLTVKDPWHHSGYKQSERLKTGTGCCLTGLNLCQSRGWNLETGSQLCTRSPRSSNLRCTIKHNSENISRVWKQKRKRSFILYLVTIRVWNQQQTSEAASWSLFKLHSSLACEEVIMLC